MGRNNFLPVVILGVLLFLAGYLIWRDNKPAPRYYAKTEKPEARRPKGAPLDDARMQVSCPRCGEWMMVRYRKKDREPFWGCSRFPRCRGTREWEGVSWYEYRTAMWDENQPPERRSFKAYREFIGDMN